MRPDAQNLAGHIADLRAGDKTAGAIAIELYAEAQLVGRYAAGLSNENFIQEAYATALNRSATTAEVAARIAQLAGGLTRQGLLLDLAEHEDVAAMLLPRLAGGLSLGGSQAWIRAQAVVGSADHERIGGTVQSDLLQGRGGNDLLDGRDSLGVLPAARVFDSCRR